MATMRVSELFHSLQGEGKLIGVPSAFLRVSGCNLRCTWCDTPYASWAAVGNEMSVDDVAAKLDSFGTYHVVLTGGEPLIMRDLPALIRQLKARPGGAHITVETAGSFWGDFLDVLQPGDIDLASISPKLSNSTPWEREGGKFAKTHEKNRINLKVLTHLATSAIVIDRQFKFVISRAQDMDEATVLIGQLNERLPTEKKIRPHEVLLMPEGTTVEELRSRELWLADLCKRQGYRYTPRLHVHLYGDTPGT